MKKIEAVIRPEKSEPVLRKLHAAGCRGATVHDVAGHGKQRGTDEASPDGELQLRPRVLVTVVVADADAENVLSLIVETARTGAVGDGKVFVSEVAEAVRIRSGERGERALR